MPRNQRSDRSSGLSRRRFLQASTGAIVAASGLASGLATRRPARAQAARQWYKADLHVHSCISSEAIADLGVLASRASAAGYNAIFVTDHNFASSFSINNLNANRMAFLDSYVRWDPMTVGAPISPINQLVSTPVFTGSQSLQLATESTAYAEVFATTRRGPNLRSGTVTLKFAVYPTRIDPGCGIYVSVAFGADPSVETPIGFTGADGTVYPSRSTVLVWQIGTPRATSISNPERRVYVNQLANPPLNQWTQYTIDVSAAVAGLPANARALDYVGLSSLKIAAASNGGGRVDAFIDGYELACASPRTPAEEFVHRGTVVHNYDTPTVKLFPAIEMGQNRHAQRLNFDIQDVSEWKGYQDGTSGIADTHASRYPAQLNHPGSAGGVSAADAINNLAYGAELMEVRADAWQDAWNTILNQGRPLMGVGTTDSHAGSFGPSASWTRIYATALDLDSLIKALFEGTSVVARNSFSGTAALRLQGEPAEPAAARYATWVPANESVGLALDIPSGLVATDTVRWISQGDVISSGTAGGTSVSQVVNIPVGTTFRWARVEARRSSGELLAATQPLFLRPVSGMPSGWRVIVDGVDSPDGKGYIRTAIQGITAANWFSSGDVLGLTSENTVGSTMRVRVRGATEPQAVQFEGTIVTRAPSQAAFLAGSGSRWWWDSAAHVLHLRLVNTQPVSPTSLYFGSAPDTQPPTAPGNFVATTPGGPVVDLSWSPSTDNLGITVYLVERDGSIIDTVPSSVTTYRDTAVELGQSYTYTVRARDAANNVSPPSEPRTVQLPAFEIVFADNFETGDLGKWDSSTALTVQQQDAVEGSWAARASSPGTPVHATAFLPTTRKELFWKLRFKKISQGSGSVYLLRFRTSNNAALLGVYVSATSRLGIRNDVSGVSTTDTSTLVPTGTWQELQVRLVVDGANSRTDVWLNGVHRPALSGPGTFGSSPIGRLNLGQSANGVAFEHLYDDIVVSTAFVPDTTVPSVPTGLVATPQATGILLQWNAASDNIAVTGYEVFRDGASIGFSPTTQFTDTATTAPGAYGYQVRARDAEGNWSALSATATATIGDTKAPTRPTGLVATLVAGAVHLAWQPASDNVAVTGYPIYRDNVRIVTVAATPTEYTDPNVEPGATYTYTVRAKDAAGNISAAATPVTVTIPSAANVFSDGFESGALGAGWTAISPGFSVQQSVVASGSFAAQAVTEGPPVSATVILPESYPELFARLKFMRAEQEPGAVYLLRFRSASGVSIMGVFISQTGRIAMRNDVTGVTTTDTTTPPVPMNTWHELQVHVRTGSGAGRIDVWLNGAPLSVLSRDDSLGSAAIQRLQFSQASSGQAVPYRYYFDDIEVRTSFIA